MESAQTYFGLVLMLVCVGVEVKAYAKFVPTGACVDMFPSGHQVLAQNSTPPFELLVSPATYSAGSTVKVTLKTEKRSLWFVGMFVQARRASDCRETTPVGTFSFASGDFALRTVNCSAPADAISHTDQLSATTKEFTWTAPKIPVGNIFFRATVVKEFSTYWTGVLSELVRGPTAASPAASSTPSAATEDYTDETTTDTDVMPTDNSDATPANTKVTPAAKSDATPANTKVTTDDNSDTTPDKTSVTPGHSTVVTPKHSTVVTPPNAASPLYPHVLPLVGAILVALLAL